MSFSDFADEMSDDEFEMWLMTQQVDRAPGEADEDLARSLQEVDLQVSQGLSVNLVDFPTADFWDGFPWEIKSKIMEPLLKVHVPVWYANIDVIMIDKLTPFCKKPSWFRRDAEQIFYQCNRFILKPSFTGTISLRYPPPRINHYFKFVEFRPCIPLDVIEEFRKSFETASPRIEDDTWQYLKNITLGKYGFQKLEVIKVTFPPQPNRMQAFWGWNIRIKAGHKATIVSPDEDDWEAKVKNAVEDRRVAQLDYKWSDMDFGFELVKKVKKAKKDGDKH